MQAIAELLQVDNDVTGNTQHVYNVTMRRYACMTLTNLTFADGANKALLCSMLPALRALVAQLDSPSEDLCQVAASVIRNLSWHSDLASRRALREVDAAVVLMRSVMTDCRRESTLKSVLSALWNLSSHSADNKADICCVPGALEFLVSLLSYRSPSKSLSVVENAGGILRNVSSHIAVRDDYRAVLRHAGCLQTLLRQLRSPSLTIVSNACGTLWNLSARCTEDQSTLLQLGAVAMLKNLVHSRHRMISMGSAAALKNLLTAAANMPCVASERSLLLDGRCGDATVTSPTSLPVGLHVRRQRAFEDELNRRQLSETCDDMTSPAASPTSTLQRSPADARSSSACLATDIGVVGSHRRIQSPSPLRLSDRSAFTPLRQSVTHRSSSHAAGVPVSHSSDEISAHVGQRGRARPAALDRSRRPTDWSSSMNAGATADNIEEMDEWGSVSSAAQMMSSFTSWSSSYQSSPTSPSCLRAATSPTLPGAALGSRRFLKSSRKTSAKQPSSTMCASFLSERTENIHLDDLELKSSFDFDACGRSVSRIHHQTAFADSEADGQKSANLSSDQPQSPPEMLLDAEDKCKEQNVAEVDKGEKSSCEAADETVRKHDDVNTSEALTSLDELMQLLPRTGCRFYYDDKSEQCVISADPSEVTGTATAAGGLHSQHGANSVLLNDDQVLNMNISTHSDVVSDIMDESFPNLTLSTISDLQSSTDLLTSDQVPAETTASSDTTASKERYEQCDTTVKEQTNSVQVDETVFDNVELVDDNGVLCCNSEELLSLLEENANRVLRALDLKTAASTSSSEVRLLEDETISLVSGGHYDNELDGDDDDYDDDYMDAISTRTYDVSSASGELACLSSRHSSSRSPSSGPDSRHSSPPVAAVKSGRPRIVKPGDNTERRYDEESTGEVKAIRGRRKALYALTRPKIPPSSQSTSRPSSAVKSRPVTVDVPSGRRPGSANSAASKPAVVRPMISKPASSVNIKACAQNASSSAVPGAPRVKPAGQSAALKKPLASTQSNVVDSKVKRRVDTARVRSQSATSYKTTVSNSSRPSSANQPANTAAAAAAGSKNERPTPPVKQATFVKAEETSNAPAADESVAQALNERVETRNKTSTKPTVAERPAVNKDRSRPSSASSVRSNKTAAPPPPARAARSTAATSRFTAASRVGLRHSSPDPVRSRTSNTNSPVRPPPKPSLPAAAKSSSSSAATSASSTARSVRSASAASVRKLGSSEPQTDAKSGSEASQKPSHSAEPATAGSALTRTSTYDKLNDADQLETSSVRTVGSDTQPSNVSVDSVSQHSAESTVLSSADSRAVVDSAELSEVVIRRARQLVEQTDQIQTRPASPPQSIRFSTIAQPVDDVVQRPCERQLNAAPQPGATNTQRQSSTSSSQSFDERTPVSQTQSDTDSSHPAPPASTSVDKPKPSPVRKFGFIGLWRRAARPEQAAAAAPVSTDGQRREETRSEVGSARRKTLSWWRRTTSPAAAAGGKTTLSRGDAVNCERPADKAAGRVFGRGAGSGSTTAGDVGRPRSPTCRAAIVTPFNYRPSAPAMFADLPESHQTKTAMLIERRMRRLKMASESGSEQTSDCCKSKPEVTSQRKNLLVTTV